MQESANDSDWATTNVFTAASSASAIEMTTNSSMSRYRRARYALAGSGIIAASLMFTSGSQA